MTAPSGCCSGIEASSVFSGSRSETSQAAIRRLGAQLLQLRLQLLRSLAPRGRCG